MMKKAVSLLAAAAIGLSANAQLGGDGYYRVQNFGSGRYVYVIDDKGRIDASTTTGDYYAIILWKGYEKALSDPASVIYIKKMSGNNRNYNLIAQGTDLHAIIGHYVNIIENKGHYLAYATNGSVTKYLSDSEFSEMAYGYLSDRANAGDNRYWDIHPIDASTPESSFGVKPTLSVEGKHYAPFYAAFPFAPVSADTKVWYVEKVVGDIAVVGQAVDGVPVSTAVYIECASEAPENNILNIGATGVKAPVANELAGVYFDNDTRTHYNRVPYDKATMRVLGVNSEGKLGFITSQTLGFLPANQSYLKVPAGTPEELRIMTREEFDAGIEDVIADSDNTPRDVYNLHGIKVRSGVTSLDGLPAGYYIVNGKKVRVD